MSVGESRADASGEDAKAGMTGGGQCLRGP